MISRRHDMQVIQGIDIHFVQIEKAVEQTVGFKRFETTWRSCDVTVMLVLINSLPEILCNYILNTTLNRVNFSHILGNTYLRNAHQTNFILITYLHITDILRVKFLDELINICVLFKWYGEVLIKWMKRSKYKSLFAPYDISQLC